MAEEFFYSLDCTVVLCSYSFSRSSVDRPHGGTLIVKEIRHASRSTPAVETQFLSSNTSNSCARFTS